MTSGTGARRRIAFLRWCARVARHPSAILLLAQLAGLLLYPFIETTPAGSFVFDVFNLVVLALTALMLKRASGRGWIAASIALPAIALNLLANLYGPSLLPWSTALEALFYFYAAGNLIAYMLGDSRATTDELFAAGATFTLLAWAFTSVFMVCQALQPGCFAAAVNADAPRSWTKLQFLSFALLSSTGIGDVIPISRHARALASLEMFVGVMYLTLVVSRLIGLTLLKRDPR